jgi:hypothetical protein
MHLEKFFHSDTGKVMFSVILGFGLASLFRSVCKDKNCIVLKAPALDEINGKTFKYNDKCYEFKPTATKCTTDKKIVQFQ